MSENNPKVVIVNDVDLAAEFGIKIVDRFPTNNQTDSLGQNKNFQDYTQ